MKKEILKLLIPEGEFDFEVYRFYEADRQIFQDIYVNWRYLCSKLEAMDARKINIPEGLSEGAFCLEMGAVRVSGGKIKKGSKKIQTSFDAYSLSSNKRIQVKACSILPDLTSFGPKSVWDELYFVDFYRNGAWDGSFDIYLIPNNLIYNNNVNKEQSMKDQQLSKRRPRFSIYKDIILVNNIKPVKTGKLF